MKDDMIQRQAALDALGDIDCSDGVGFSALKYDAINDAVTVIKALPSAQPEPEEFEWCHTCREYDQEKHCCHRWTKVIRQTVEDMKAAQPGWIPVTKKPIEGGQYIVTLKDDKEVWTDIAEWNPTFGGRWQAEFFDCEYRDIDNVVAWMPLPEPWKGGQE